MFVSRSRLHIPSRKQHSLCMQSHRMLGPVVQSTSIAIDCGCVATDCTLTRMMLEEHDDLLELAESQNFLDAVRDGNDLAGA